MCYAWPVDALAALADPTRRELVGLLAAGRTGRGRARRPLPGEPAGDQPAPAGAPGGGPGPRRGSRASDACTRSTRGRCGSSTTGSSPTATCGPSGWTHWTPRSPAAGGHERAESRHDRGPRDPAGRGHDRGRRAAAAGVPAVAGRIRSRTSGRRSPSPTGWPAGSASTRASGGAGGTGTFAMTQEEGEPRRAAPPDPRVRPAAPPGGRVGAGGARRTGGSTSTSGPRSGRTVLRFVQIFPAGADVTDMALGWHWYLDKLGAEIDGGTAPGGLGRLRRRGGTGLPAAPDRGGRARPSRPRPARPATHDGRLDGSRPPGRRWARQSRSGEVAGDHQHAEHAQQSAGRRRPDAAARRRIANRSAASTDAGAL